MIVNLKVIYSVILIVDLEISFIYVLMYIIMLKLNEI